MAPSNSTEIIQGIIKQLRLLPALNQVPTEVLNQIVPVYIAGSPRPKEIIARSASRLSNGTTALFRTPADKDFYLTSVSCVSCGPGADGKEGGCNESHIKATINGTVQKLLIAHSGFGASGTANEGHISLSFAPPILLTKNTDIDLLMANNAGGSASATMTGYEESTAW